MMIGELQRVFCIGNTAIIAMEQACIKQQKLSNRTMYAPKGNLCSLSIRPAKSYLTRKVDTFSENDAYVKFQLGSQKHKTSVKLDQRTPSWDEEYTINPELDNVLLVIVMDEDQVTDDQVGRGSIDLTPFMQEGKPAKQWVSIKYGRKPAGKVLLEMTPCTGTGKIPSNYNNQGDNKKIPNRIGAEDMSEQIFKQYLPQQQTLQQQPYQQPYQQQPYQQSFQQQPQSILSSIMSPPRQQTIQSNFVTPSHQNYVQPSFQSQYVQPATFSQTRYQTPSYQGNGSLNNGGQSWKR